MIPEEIEAKWDRMFAASQSILEQMADEARADRAAGRTKPLTSGAVFGPEWHGWADPAIGSLSVWHKAAPVKRLPRREKRRARKRRGK